ncbi:MAG: ABC transporter permease [Rickettsiaceae bacterium]
MIKRNAIALKTLFNKELKRILRIWPQTLLPPVITISLYFIIFGTIIGARLGSVHGVSYIEYIVPGLIMLAVINNAYTNVVSSFFSAKFQRNLEELLVSPMYNSIIIIGFISGGIFRGLMVGAIVTFISSFFIVIHIQHLFFTIMIALLTAALFSLAGLLNGIFARKFDDISIIPTFVLTPMTYLGGVFYSINALPNFWQYVSHLNPVFYMINAFRYGFLGHSDVHYTHSLFIILSFIVAGYSLALWLFYKGYGMRS